jgi:hypothetical protein
MQPRIFPRPDQFSDPWSIGCFALAEAASADQILGISNLAGDTECLPAVSVHVCLFAWVVVVSRDCAWITGYTEVTLLLDRRPG